MRYICMGFWKGESEGRNAVIKIQSHFLRYLEKEWSFVFKFLVITFFIP